MIASIVRMIRDERGASMVEYVLILTLIAILAIAAINTFGQNIQTTLNSEALSI